MSDAEPLPKYVPALASVPTRLPALSRAHQLLSRAAEQKFDWPDSGFVIRKIKEELVETEQAVAAGDKAHMAEEIGDLLSAVANLARFEGLDPEACLQAANDKFVKRYTAVEREIHAEGGTMPTTPLKEMIQRWNAQKDAPKTPDRA